MYVAVRCKVYGRSKVALYVLLLVMTDEARGDVVMQVGWRKSGKLMV